jgi:hypothetical protein
MDLLRLPSGHASRLKVRSLLGLTPIAASVVVTGAEYSLLPHFEKRSQWLAKRHPEVACNRTMWIKAQISRLGGSYREYYPFSL